MTSINVNVAEEVGSELASPTGGIGGEWSTVDKKTTRRLVPQHSLSKDDLGKDSKSSGGAAGENAKKKGF